MGAKSSDAYMYFTPASVFCCRRVDSPFRGEHGSWTASRDGGEFNQRWARVARSGGEFGKAVRCPEKERFSQGGCGGWHDFGPSVHSRPHLKVWAWTAQSRMDKGFSSIRPNVHKSPRAGVRVCVRARARESSYVFMTLIVLL